MRISRGDLDAGVVIPYDYARDLQRGRPVTVQFLLNAMNANTAAIAQGYAEGVIADLQRRSDERRASRQLHAGPVPMSATAAWCSSPGLSLQSRPGRLMVHRDRNIRSAADPERFHRRLRRDGEGARSRNHRAIADVAGRDVRDHRRENRAAVFSAVPDGAVRDGA